MSTAIVYDERFAMHTLAGHPEHAGRLEAILSRLMADELLERCTRCDVREVTEEQMLAVHAVTLVNQLAKVAGHQGTLGLDTYVVPQSYEIARLAAGGGLSVVDAVMNGEADNGLALIRPPGHHATASAAMGFCLLNNIAIAARYANMTHGLERVLIVDYDVHHGNGTQDIFYEDPRVLYISTHQSPLYPGTGRVNEIGTGRGTGFTLNIPLPPGVGDEGYQEAFERVIAPAARRYQPQLMLVSVGFDAHRADPLANMELSLSGYDALARGLIALADDLCAGRIIFMLEGGYNLDALGYGVGNLARALLKEDFLGDALGISRGDEPSIARIIEQVLRTHNLT